MENLLGNHRVLNQTKLDKSSLYNMISMKPWNGTTLLSSAVGSFSNSTEAQQTLAIVQAFQPIAILVFFENSNSGSRIEVPGGCLKNASDRSGNS